jgi:hypothetical protein
VKWEKKGILAQKEEKLLFCMNLAVGNVEKDEKISKNLRIFAKKIYKTYCIIDFHRV